MKQDIISPCLPGNTLFSPGHHMPGQFFRQDMSLLRKNPTGSFPLLFSDLLDVCFYIFFQFQVGRFGIIEQFTPIFQKANSQCFPIPIGVQILEIFAQLQNNPLYLFIFVGNSFHNFAVTSCIQNGGKQMFNSPSLTGNKRQNRHSQDLLQVRSINCYPHPGSFVHHVHTHYQRLAQL